MHSTSSTYTYMGPTQQGLKQNQAYPVKVHFFGDQVNVELLTAPFVIYTYEEFDQFSQCWIGGGRHRG